MQCSAITQTGEQCSRNGKYQVNGRYYCRQHYDLTKVSAYDVSREYSKNKRFYHKTPKPWVMMKQLAQKQESQNNQAEILPAELVLQITNSMQFQDLYNFVIAYPAYFELLKGKLQNGKLNNLEFAASFSTNPTGKRINRYLYPNRWVMDDTGDISFHSTKEDIIHELKQRPTGQEFEPIDFKSLDNYNFSNGGRFFPIKVYQLF